MKILAMDLGKGKSVACQYEAATGEHTFETIRTSRQEIHDLLVSVRPARVVIEVCPAAGFSEEPVVTGQRPIGPQGLGCGQV